MSYVDKNANYYLFLLWKQENERKFHLRIEDLPKKRKKKKQIIWKIKNPAEYQ